MKTTISGCKWGGKPESYSYTNIDELLYEGLSYQKFNNEEELVNSLNTTFDTDDKDDREAFNNTLNDSRAFTYPFYEFYHDNSSRLVQSLEEAITDHYTENFMKHTIKITKAS